MVIDEFARRVDFFEPKIRRITEPEFEVKPAQPSRRTIYAALIISAVLCGFVLYHKNTAPAGEEKRGEETASGTSISTDTGATGTATPPEEAAKRAERIRGAIRRLNSPSEFLRAEAEKFLVQAGDEAVPFLEAEVAKMREKITPLVAVLELIRAKKPILAGESEHDSKENIEKYFREKFAAAKEALEGGNPRLARAMTDAMLVLEPNLPFKREIQAFRVRCEEQVVRAEILACRLEPQSLVAAQGETIKIDLVVTNVSNGAVTVHPAAATGTFGVLRRDVTELSYDGRMNMYGKPLPKLALAESFTLEQGKRWVKPILVDTNVFAQGKGVHVVLELSGTLRPGAVETGGQSLSRYMVVPPVSIRIVPKDYVALAEKPDEELERASNEAIAIARDPKGEHPKDAYERLFHCALFASDVNPDRAISVLIRTLNRVDKAGERVAIAALRRITGRDFTGEAQEWIDWWYSRELGK